MVATGALILLVAALAAQAPETSSEAARKALSIASGKALQGDSRAALDNLRAVPDGQFNARDLKVRNCMIARFDAGSAIEPASDSDSFTDQAIVAYRTYWHAALTDPGAKDAAEARLESSLRDLLGLPPDTEWSAIEAALQQRFAADGVHALMGRTPPLLELMVWKSETSDVRQVQLPEGTHPAKVKILDDFPSLGWSAFATCDRSFTGGWVGSEAVHAVRPGWKSLTDENFLVSFLAHETQHFADKEKFGDIESWELEYRAKLAELALADETLPRLLRNFASNQGQDQAIPHSYANWLALAHLRALLDVPSVDGLDAVESARIKSAAENLLRRDSARRARQ